MLLIILLMLMPPPVLRVPGRRLQGCGSGWLVGGKPTSGPFERLVRHRTGCKQGKRAHGQEQGRKAAIWRVSKAPCGRGRCVPAARACTLFWASEGSCRGLTWTANLRVQRFGGQGRVGWHRSGPINMERPGACVKRAVQFFTGQGC